jgi:hypothetical protein
LFAGVIANRLNFVRVHLTGECQAGAREASVSQEVTTFSAPALPTSSSAHNTPYAYTREELRRRPLALGREVNSDSVTPLADASRWRSRPFACEQAQGLSSSPGAVRAAASSMFEGGRGCAPSMS